VTEGGRCVTVYDIRTESFVGYPREFKRPCCPGCIRTGAYSFPL